jgi:hypothetical protein
MTVKESLVRVERAAVGKARATGGRWARAMGMAAFATSMTLSNPEKVVTTSDHKWELNVFTLPRFPPFVEVLIRRAKF